MQHHALYMMVTLHICDQMLAHAAVMLAASWLVRLDQNLFTLLLKHMNRYMFPAVHQRQHRVWNAMGAVGAASAQRGLIKASTAVQSKQIQSVLGTAKG